MTAIAGAIMVGSAGLCLGGAVHARRLLGIIAAAVMLFSMIDLAYFNLLPAIFWAGLLVTGAMLLGLDFRIGRSEEKLYEVEANHKVTWFSKISLHSAVMISSALAYPAAAWLALTHDHSGPTISPNSAPPASGHVHGSSGILSSAPSITIALLIITLAVLGVLTLRRHNIGLVVESFGMAAMLAVMML